MKKKKGAKYWIRKLKLAPHPEGGFFREVYHAPERLERRCLPKRYDGQRPFSTSIYFLLAGLDFSAFHKLKSDEVWHFYAGAPLTLVMITPTGRVRKIHLGPRSRNGFQYVVPRGVWFASICDDPKSYSLVGCTVAPGFDFRDFELARRQDLVKRFPRHRSLVVRFTRSHS